jgi:hypothetical protein
MAQTPKKPGFYWAKWRIADEDTHEANEWDMQVLGWEVVDVFENHTNTDHPEHLRVQVSGVRESQHLENFIWGSDRLEPPK